MPTSSANASDIARRLASAAKGVARLREQRQALAREIESIIAAANSMLGQLGSAAGPGVRVAPRRRRRLSPEGREKIRAALKKRWAKYHAERNRSARRGAAS
jgi:hypothetical protein